MTISKKLRELRDEVTACKMCKASKYRIKPVMGQGSHAPRVIFIGESPSREENLSGFCSVLKNQVKETNCYLCYAIKCFIPQCHNLTDEVENCSVYLHFQIELLKPDFIVTLGINGMKAILKLYSDLEPDLEKDHGKIFDLKLDGGKFVKYIPMKRSKIKKGGLNLIYENKRIREKFKAEKRTTDNSNYK